MEYLFTAPMLNLNTLWLLFEIEVILHKYTLFRHMGLNRPAFIFYVILFKDQSLQYFFEQTEFNHLKLQLFHF